MTKLIERVQAEHKRATDDLPRLQLDVRDAEQALERAQAALADAMSIIADADEAIPLLEEAARVKGDVKVKLNERA